MNYETDPILKERLVADAQAMSSEFSPSLHGRTVRAMRQAQAGRPATMTISESMPLVPWWRAGLAVAATIALATAGWWLYSEPGVLRQLPHQTAAIIGMQISDPAPKELRVYGSPLSEVLTVPAPRVDRLEQQARTVARYVAQQFPPSMVQSNEQRL